MSHKPFAFFGTPYVARDTLAHLVESGYVPSVVVTSPDAPRGRGLVLTPCETKAWALEHDLPVLTPVKLDTAFLETMQSYGCMYAIVVAYGKILPKGLIELFPDGVINIHYSLLPKYRGASPVEGALLAGETETGVTIQRMVYELDAGDILAHERTAILPEETTRELRPRLVSLGATLLTNILPSFEDGSITAVPQDHEHATFTKKIKKEMGLLTLSDNASENWNRYRAYAESPGTYFFLETKGKPLRVKIRTATFKDGTFVPLQVVPENGKDVAFETLLRNGI